MRPTEARVGGDKYGKGARVASQAVVIAPGVSTDGRREVLGCAVGDSETQDFWAEFLRSLRDRGLGGTQLVISDHHRGLMNAIEATMAGVAWQRCRVHFMRNGKYGTPVDPRTLNRRFTARCNLAGVRHMTVHDARRTCATLLVDLEVHPRVIMRILRHADVAMTMEIYADVNSKATSEALRRLGESLR